jgi:hypothetical protein
MPTFRAPFVSSAVFDIATTASLAPIAVASVQADLATSARITAFVRYNFVASFLVRFVSFFLYLLLSFSVFDIQIAHCVDIQ